METLETDRLRLRPVGLEDAAFVVDLLNDPGFLANIGDRGVRTVDEARAYIASAPLCDGSKGLGFNVVVEKASGERIGTCGLVKRDTLDAPDVGYALLERFAGRGYASEAAGAALAQGLGGLGLRRVLAITSVGNAGSRRVLEKIGMRLERVAPMAGYEGDTCLYAAGADPE